MIRQGRINVDTMGLQTLLRAQNSVFHLKIHLRQELGSTAAFGHPYVSSKGPLETMGSTTASSHLPLVWVTPPPMEERESRHRPFFFSPLASPSVAKSSDFLW